MKPLVTLGQIQTVFKLITLYHDALLVELLGDDVVSPERLEEIKKSGLYEKARRDIVQRSFEHGRAAVDNPKVLDMGDEAFEDYLKDHEMPLSKADKDTLGMLRDSFKTYTSALGENIKQRFSKAAMEANKHATRASVVPGANELLERRSALAKLAKDMASAVPLEVTDAIRVVETEANNIYQNGRAQKILDNSGEADPLVYKQPRKDACFLAGTKVVTKRGSVPIERVVVGDEVLTHRLRWRRVSAIYSRLYNGEILGLDTAPNMTGAHPVLSNLDWARADSVEHGAYLIHVDAVTEPKYNPASVLKKLLFGQVSTFCGTCGVPIPTIQLYSHLQRRNSDVDVPYIDSKFRNGKEVCESLGEFETDFRGARQRTLPSACFLSLSGWKTGFSAALVRCFRNLFTLCFRHVKIANMETVSGVVGDVVLDNSAFNNFRTNPEFAGYGEQCVLTSSKHSSYPLDIDLFSMVHASKLIVSLRKVKSIVRSQFTGAVFNLEIEDDHSYIADGTLVHNCKECIDAYTVDGVIPRVFRLSELVANGSNVGRRRPNRLPVLDSLHPYCVCNLLWMPPGFDFDRNGTLIPKPKVAS